MTEQNAPKPDMNEAPEAAENVDSPQAPADQEVEQFYSEQSDNIPLDGIASSSEVDRLTAELAKMKEQALRALAEAENTRRRAQKDREDATKFAIASFARDLLPVADNMRRALDAISSELVESSPEVKNLMDGINATERELLRTFEKNGMEKIEPMGQAFDPNMHEVMFEMPAGGKPAGTILQVMEPGYALKGRILRPARVGVAADEGQGAAAPSAAGDDSVDVSA